MGGFFVLVASKLGFLLAQRYFINKMDLLEMVREDRI